MYRFANCFRPISQVRITMYLFLMIIYHSLLITTTLCAAPEDFTMVRVPGLIKETQADAEKTIKEKYLTVGNITLKFTNEWPPGTVVDQSPAEGNRVKMWSRVDICVAERMKKPKPAGLAKPPREEAPAPTPKPADVQASQPQSGGWNVGEVISKITDFAAKMLGHRAPEPSSKEAPPAPELSKPPSVPPHARIDPITRFVHQGEEAYFESNSFPQDGINEEWSGPLNQHGTGKRFSVFTKSLKPSTYAVNLQVTDKSGQSDRTRAMLVVSAKPPPPTPLPPHYSANITADKENIHQSESVKFTAELTPARMDVSYCFYFGDGKSEILRHPNRTVSHTYDSAKKFKAFVKVFYENEMVTKSNNIEVDVQPAIVPIWVWIGTALLVGVCAGYIVFKPNPRLQMVPRDDNAGSQSIDDDMSRLVGPEICLVPVSDMGKQEILEQQTPFIREERWENE